MPWFAGTAYRILAESDRLAPDNSEVENVSIFIPRFKPRFPGRLASRLIHNGQEQAAITQRHICFLPAQRN